MASCSKDVLNIWLVKILKAAGGILNQYALPQNAVCIRTSAFCYYSLTAGWIDLSQNYNQPHVPQIDTNKLCSRKSLLPKSISFSLFYVKNVLAIVTLSVALKINYNNYHIVKVSSSTIM